MIHNNKTFMQSHSLVVVLHYNFLDCFYSDSNKQKNSTAAETFSTFPSYFKL